MDLSALIILCQFCIYAEPFFRRHTESIGEPAKGARCEHCDRRVEGWPPGLVRLHRTWPPA